MPRYIDVEKIKLTAETMVGDDGTVYVSLEDVRRAIASTPVDPDVVKVVRCIRCCKPTVDCSNRVSWGCELMRPGSCGHNDMAFCSRGFSREEFDRLMKKSMEVNNNGKS